MSAAADANQLLDFIIGLDLFRSQIVGRQKELQQHRPGLSSDDLNKVLSELKALDAMEQAHFRRVRELIEKVLAHAYAAGLGDPQNPLDEMLSVWWYGPGFDQLKHRCIIYARQLARQLAVSEQTSQPKSIDPIAEVETKCPPLDGRGDGPNRSMAMLMDQDQPHEHQPSAEAERKAEQKKPNDQTAYWHDVGLYLNYCFSEHWGGVLVFGVAIGSVFIWLSTLKIDPLWWAGIGAASFVGLISFVLIYVACTRKKPSPPYRPPTLWQFFRSDFTDLTLDSEVSVGNPNDSSRQQIPCRVIADFQARSKYFAIFVPRSENAIEICRVIAENFELLVAGVGKGVSVIARVVGESNQTHIADLIFSGRIFIYHEDHFSSHVLSELEIAFRSRDADVIFRGPDYLAFKTVAGRRAP